MIIVLKVFLPIFMVMFIGFYMGKQNIIKKDTGKDIGNIIMSIFLPALLLSSTSKIKASVLFNPKVLLSFSICLISIYLITYFIYNFSLKKGSQISALASLTTSQPNISFMGIIILLELYGEQSLVLIILSNIVVSFILMPLTLSLLNKGKAKKITVNSVILKIKETILTPIVLAPILGILLSLFDVTLSKELDVTLSYLGNIAPGLSLFLMGLSMSAHPLVFNKEIFIQVLTKNLMAPLVMVIIASLLNIGETIAGGLVILSSLPSASTSTMFSLEYNIYQRETSSAVLLGTLFSLISVGIFIINYK